MKKIRFRSSTTFFIILTVVLFIFLVIILNSDGIRQNSTKEIYFEILKSLLELVVITISGAFVGVLLHTSEEKKTKERIKTDTRTDYLLRLGQQYRKVKSARRMLRGYGLSTKKGSAIALSEKTAPYYLEQIRLINDAQLELEGLAIEASRLPHFVSLISLKENLVEMANYLNEIISEFEEKNSSIQHGEITQLEKLSRLDEFTGKIRYELETPNSKKIRYTFEKNFSLNYENSVRLISQNL